MMHGFVKYIVRFYFPRHNYYNKILQLIKVRFIADFQCEIKLIKHQNIFHNLFFFSPHFYPRVPLILELTNWNGIFLPTFACGILNVIFFPPHWGGFWQDHLNSFLFIWQAVMFHYSGSPKGPSARLLHHIKSVNCLSVCVCGFLFFPASACPPKLTTTIPLGHGDWWC